VRHDVDQATGLLKAELVSEEELEHRKKTQMVSCRGVSVSMVSICVCAMNGIAPRCNEVAAVFCALVWVSEALGVSSSATLCDVM
jgi:hypothetical protein